MAAGALQPASRRRPSRKKPPQLWGQTIKFPLFTQLDYHFLVLLMFYYKEATRKGI